LVRKPETNSHGEDLEVYGRITLKWFLKVLTGLSWLRIVTGCELL
jgi:hypothetical protein